jgi:hypothetical protein
MIARHTDAGREKAVFFPVDTVVAAVPMPDQVSPPRRPRGRPGAVAKPAENKPAGKPYKSFPLTPHRSGQFCKKIRGKIFYFGKVDDPDAALKRYHEHCRDLHSGKATRVERTDEITVAELANEFLSAKDRKRVRQTLLIVVPFVKLHFENCQLKFITMPCPYFKNKTMKLYYEFQVVNSI